MLALAGTLALPVCSEYDNSIDCSLHQSEVKRMETATYLDRMLEPVGGCLTPEVARRLVQLRADPQLQARIDELAGRCTEGDLTEEEKSEYETYVRAGNLIAILQAKARKLLATLGRA
jgi:hypothetical protein